VDKEEGQFRLYSKCQMYDVNWTKVFLVILLNILKIY
jgi:hypothetical protein